MKRTILAVFGLVIIAGAGTGLHSAQLTRGGLPGPDPHIDFGYDHDVGVANYRPWALYLVGDTIWFQPVIKNFGRHTEAFDVLMVGYEGDSVPVSSETLAVVLAPGDSTVLEPAVRYRVFDRAGVYVIFACSTRLDGDQDPANDGGRYRAIVFPPAVDFIEILSAPGETIPMHRTIRLGVRIRNPMPREVRTWVIAKIEHTCSSHTWQDSIWVRLPSGTEAVLTFSPWTPRYPGPHRFQFAAGTGDSTPWLYFYVKDEAGIAEPAGPGDNPDSPLRISPNPAGHRVRLEGGKQAALYAPDGRLVAVLQPGENDVRHLSPGVYFIRASLWERSQDRDFVRKVVIQR